MTRLQHLTLFVFVICVHCVLALAQLPATAAQEKVIRETYRKLEIYNAAAQVFQNEQSPSRRSPADAKLSFALTGFRSGTVAEIMSRRYAELVTLPAGEIVSLTRGRHSLDDGPEEASFVAAWERGQYASVFDPEWTIADVLNFEPARYYDISSYTSYEVTVNFEGKSRTYRALALFHRAERRADLGVPEFWDGVVHGLNRVWEEKRPPYTSKTQNLTPSAAADTGAAEISFEETGTGDDRRSRQKSGTGERLGTYSTSISLSSDELFVTATPLPLWLSQDETEHISGHHAGTANYTGACSLLTNNLQRCRVAVSEFAVFDTGTLSTITPFFSHIGTKDLKTENRTGAIGTTVPCGAATGVAVSSCLIGTSCGASASVSISVLIASASSSVSGGNMWRDSNAEHFTCNLSLTGGNCTTPILGICPIGTTPNGSGLCCFSTNSCSLALASRCFRFDGDFDFETCRCLGCSGCGGSPIVLDIKGDGISLTDAVAGVEFDLNGDGVKERLGWTKAAADDAWLVLDRDGNGTIDTGAELFGDYTPQPDSEIKNGFLALAEFDKAVNGGNGDGRVDQQDAIFGSLRLWQDKNHNGISEPEELHTLASLNVQALELEFQESKRVDEFGNEFKYRAKVKDSAAGRVARWAWDVFLVQ